VPSVSVSDSPQEPLVPPVITKVLMAEVENVTHDPFKVTEEVKVPLCYILIC
jgi:hypothetical protein